jgi:hypothetical protein
MNCWLFHRHLFRVDPALGLLLLLQPLVLLFLIFLDLLQSFLLLDLRISVSPSTEEAVVAYEIKTSQLRWKLMLTSIRSDLLAAHLR